MGNYPSATPDFEMGYSGDGVVGIVYLIYSLVMWAISIGSYVFMSLGLYTMAKRRGIRKPWLAWLPIGNLWILGCISDQYQYVAKGNVKNKRKTLLILNILMYVAAFAILIIAAVMIGAGIFESVQPDEVLIDTAFLIGIIVSFVAAWAVTMVLTVTTAVIEYMALYDLYTSCDPKNNLLYLLLSIFVSITLPIFVFICRNKELGMPPRKQDPAAFIPPEPVEVPPWRPVQNTADPWENNPEQ